MKKIAYIVTDLYPPAFAPRVASMVKYMKDYGIEPIVFTERQTSHLLFSDYVDTCKTFRFSLTKGNIVSRKADQIMELIFQSKERKFEKQIEVIVDALELPKPDVIISFCYRKFPITTAYRLSKKYKVPFIADCRDIIEQYKDFLPKSIKIFGIRLRGMESVVRGLFIGKRNKSLAKASVVTTVSYWHQKKLQSFTKNPVEVIYNGYDTRLFTPNLNKINNSFDIVFTGRIISKELRDPSILFYVVKELQEECPLLRLHFYTDDYSRKILEGINKEIGSPLYIHPMVEYSAIPNVLDSASIIALISNSARDGGAEGMISTKIFEALVMCRPIVLLPDDEGEAADIIRKSKRGIATKDKNELKDFIKGYYREWQSTSKCIIRGDEYYVAQFDRKLQAKAMADIIYRISK